MGGQGHDDEPVDRPRVVVGLDGTPGSRAAAVVAARSATRRGVPLRAVVAVEPPSRGAGRSWAAVAGVPLAPIAETARRTAATARGVLDDVLRQVRREDGAAPDAEVTTVIGPAAEVVLDAARESDELVLGHRGRGRATSVLLGSVGLTCVLHARCPVTVVPPPVPAEGPAPTRVVVGVDGSEDSRAAVTYALREAGRRGAPLTAVVAYPDEAVTWPAMADVPPWPQDLARVEVERAAAMVDAAAAAVRRAGDPVGDVEVTGAPGSPGAVLTDATWEAALLVVGHRGRGAARSVLLGSTGLGCLVRAVCPVTVVPPGWTAPARGRPGEVLTTEAR